MNWGYGHFSNTFLENANHILIAGAGGGFDVFCGLPLYFNLIAQGKTVYLANLTFTQLRFIQGEWVTPKMMKVTAETQGLEGLYFPEWYLARWFEQKGMVNTPIYTFEKTGVLPLIQNYQTLIDSLQLDTIILVDGGTDSLMRGDEDGLGTPGEDFTSLAAVASLDIPQKMLLCLGFGVDHYHGVSNDLTFAAIAELTQSKGFLGSTSLLTEMPEVKQYQQAIEFVSAAMPEDVSIVSSSIVSALEGHYGNYHTNKRTAGSKLWINPLMAVYWFFDLHIIADRNLMLEHLLTTEYFDQVVRTIMVYRHKYVQRRQNRDAIPD